ncbi:MAG: NAD-dependent epimerase/dehydratase family protein [Chthoniobacterales bacterium]
MGRILIAGCGYAGSATADLFHAAQWEVEGWTRSPETAAQLAAKPYRVRAVDIADRRAVEAANRSFDAVIHCASSGGGSAEGYRRIYLEGATNLLDAFRPACFVFTSSTSVYAQTGGEWVDEESAAEPSHETGRILRRAEEFVRRSGALVARLTGIYGPGRSAILRKFLSGEARLENRGERFQNQVHRDDIAAALLFLITLSGERWPAAQIINVTDNEPITQRASYQWLAANLNRPLPAVATRTGQRKRGASNKRVSNRKLRALGWEPKFPTFQIGMESSVLPAYPTLGA